MEACEPATASPEHRARLAWARIAEPDDRTARAMIAEHGLLEALDMARRGHSGRARANAQRFRARLVDLNVDRDAEVTAKIGARVLFPGDPGWPSSVDELAMPPWCLWARGPIEPADLIGRSVALVGARASTSYGEFVAADMAAGLSGRGFSIISGAAFGIDAAAHRGCLADDGQTVAVLAGGVDRPYPAAHASLLARIGDVGAIVSEVPPGSAPTRSRFLARNRLIAALATGTVMVEAGLRSGARSTVTAALALNRPVGAVPGPVTSMVSAGCHEDIRAGRASLVTDAAEVAELCGAVGQDLAEPKQGEVRASDDLDPETFRVWQSLRVRRASSVDSLATTAGLSIAEVMAALGRLEIAAMARRTSTGWCRCQP